jgi:hypothetical protein
MADRLTDEQIKARREARRARGKGVKNNPDRLIREGVAEPMEEYDINQRRKFFKRVEGKQERIGSKNRADMDARERQRALRSLVKKSSDISKLAKSDIRTINSLATSAANKYKDTTSKDAIQKALKATPASKSLLSVVARSAGILGAAVTMNEFRKVHKQITDNPTKKYGQQTLLDILMKD